ncbi:MAG: hypothetical protein NY202_04715 [Mollicutes bacterium UO1]
MDKETDGQRLDRINQAIKQGTQGLDGSAKKDQEKKISDKERKTIKGKCGHEVEKVCN